MQVASETLDEFGVPHETRIVSAHRTPDLLFEFAKGAEGRGIEVIVAGPAGRPSAGNVRRANCSSRSWRAVESKALKGLDSLLSIAQMPAGIPVERLP